MTQTGCLACKRSKAGRIQLPKACQETAERRSDLFCATCAVAFDVERHKRLVERQAKQRPAITLGGRKGYAHAFIVWLSQRPAGLRGCIFLERRDDSIPVVGKRLRLKRHTEFKAFFRFF